MQESIIGLLHLYTFGNEAIPVETSGKIGNYRTDVLRLADGENATVMKVWTEALDEKVPVYNFEVAECHTYYVSELGVLVHNMCAVGNTNTSRLIGTTKNATRPSYYSGVQRKK